MAGLSTLSKFSPSARRLSFEIDRVSLPTDLDQVRLWLSFSTDDRGHAPLHAVVVRRNIRRGINNVMMIEESDFIHK